MSRGASSGLEATERAPRVVFVNQHYHPDIAATSQRLTDLAEFLAARGFAVEVVTGRGGYVGESRGAPLRETRNGVRIRRMPMTRFGRGSSPGRLVDYATFMLGAFAFLLVHRRADLVVALTTPPLLGSLGAMLRLVRRQRYGIWSMDLHPDAEIALGMLPPRGPVTSVIAYVNELGYSRADFVVDLGAHMQERILEKGVDEHRAVTIPVWGNDPEPVEPVDNELIDEWGLRGKFVVLYAGNAGLAHRFDEILEAMARLREHDDIVFLFVGGGARREAITEFATRHGIRNFQYRDYVPQSRLGDVLSAGDVHLITLRPDMVGVAVPSKLYDSLAIGRPVLMLGPEESDTGEAIRTSGAGFVVDPALGSSVAAERIVQHLLELHREPTLRSECARAGRACYARRFRREVLCQQWEELLRARLQPDRATPGAPVRVQPTAPHSPARPS